MAFFKTRKGGDESLATPSQPESIEAMRRRARHRLIGAVVLVLIGVVGFPLLFDTQPRPIAVDIPIEIPDRNKVKPLPGTARPVAQAASAAGAVTPPASPEIEPKVAVAPAPATSAAIKTEAPEAPAAPEPKPQPEAKVAKAEPKPEPKPEPRPEPKAEKPAAPSDGAKARALLEGQPVEAAAQGRYVVQVGAFADPVKARETRLKVEKTGIRTYTHVAETKEGKRIRVRVGPFPTRAEADKAADLIKGLDLPAAVLTL